MSNLGVSGNQDTTGSLPMDMIHTGYVAMRIAAQGRTDSINSEFIALPHNQRSPRQGADRLAKALQGRCKRQLAPDICISHADSA